MTCSTGTLSAFGLEANILGICCSTGEFLSDLVKVTITAIFSVTPPDIGVAWLIIMGGCKIDMCVRSQVRKRGKVGFDQSLIYTYSFPQLSSQCCFLASFNSLATRNF
jgi:hypothetical protein